MLVGVAERYDYGAVSVNGTTLVQSVDIITPVCRAARDFGAIAVAHALSDIFAAGATPLCAVATLVIPDGSLPIEAASELLKSVSDNLRKENCHLIGGHTMRAGENLLIGVTVTGTVTSQKLLKPVGAKDGDVLILTKPLGTGLYIAADRSNHPGLNFSEAMDVMLRNNRFVLSLRDEVPVHAAIDISGFGLADALHRLAMNCQLKISILFKTIPLLSQAGDLARLGFHTRLTDANYLDNIGSRSLLGIATEDLLVLCDPQTSGGLLIAIPKTHGDVALDFCRREGHSQASAIGFFSAGAPVIDFLP